MLSVGNDYPRLAELAIIASMLQIREAQMAAFREARRKDFLRRLENYVRQQVVSGLLPIHPERVPEQVQAGIEAARLLRLINECDILSYIVIVCRYLGGFPVDHPRPALHLLLRPGVPSAARLRQFEEWVVQQRS